MERTLIVGGVIAGTFVLLFLLERLLPLRRPVSALIGRLLVNLIVSALAFGAAAIIVRPAAYSTLGWSTRESFGLIPLLDLPPAASFVTAFVLMDLTFYYWHVANHKVPFLWRFHNVHHIDPDLDVSTGFRFHFGEVAFSAALRVAQATLIGLSPWTYAAYELVFQGNTLFHHSNLRLPIRVERQLNRILVTPRMHGIHHSQVEGETNSNFSVIFPWWDRLHRTLKLNVPQSRIVIGVPAYATAEDNRLWSALAMPFRRQRDYWSRPDGTRMERDPADEQDRRNRMVE